MERIVPANLDGDELWRRNGEYVDAESYETAAARIVELEIGILAAIRHAERNGMAEWPAFVKLRKLMKQ